MNQEPTSSKSIQEILRDLFYSIFRSAGVSLSVDKLDSLKITCDQLAKTLDKYAYDSAVVAIKRLQVAVGDAFKEVSKDIDRMQDNVKKEVQRQLEKHDKKIQQELEGFKKNIRKEINK